MKTTKSNPWAAMDAIVNANPEPMGEEWFTVEQFATRYQCTEASAFSRLSRLHAIGTVDRWAGIGTASRRKTTKWRVKPDSLRS